MALKTFSWTAPTSREDGSPLDPTTLSYRLYVDGVALVDFPGSLNPDGTYFYQREFAHGKYTAELTALDSEGRESKKSNSVPFEVVSAPSAPTNLTVD